MVWHVYHNGTIFETWICSKGVKITSCFSSFHQFCFSTVTEKWHLNPINLVPSDSPVNMSLLELWERASLGKWWNVLTRRRNIVKYIECFQTIRGKALVFETLDISLFDYMKLNKCALCFWVTSEPSSNRYEHSTIRWRAKKCTFSFRLESVLTYLVLSVGHSIWCTEGDRGDPHWCQAGQHYDGESQPATL